MKPPLVSVIIPVYNAEKYLQLAIDSILHQTYSNFELILVNDCSTDKSKEICLANKDQRIIFVENEKNLGIALTRNMGFSHAKGKYIAILDNDDIALPNRLEEQVNFLEQNPDFGMCGTFYSLIDSDNKVLFKVELPTDPTDIRTILLFQNCFNHSTALYRYELGKEFQYQKKYDAISEYEIWLKMASKTKLANLPKYCGMYRIHGKNFSIKRSDTMQFLLKNLEAEILDDLHFAHTPEELTVYSYFLNYNFKNLTNTADLILLEKFLVRLHEHLKWKDDINIRLVQKFITRRWVMVCFKSGKYSRILSFKLINNFSFSFFHHFFQQMVDKIANRHLVYEN